MVVRKRHNAAPNEEPARITKRAKVEEEEEEDDGDSWADADEGKDDEQENDKEEEDDEDDEDEDDEVADDNKDDENKEIRPDEDENDVANGDIGHGDDNTSEIKHQNGTKATSDDEDDKNGSKDKTKKDSEEDDDDEDEDEAEEEKKRITTFKFDGVSYSFKERPSVIEEKEGKIEFRVVNNDNTRENLMVLTGLKNIFQKQLPKMPREYISRLVYDRSHLSMAVVRKPLTVVGGITYRPFNNREFAEIVFCAILSTEQVRGYGAHLMNHLKDYVRATSPIKYFLTYADNYAIGYFKKQGFTKEITLEKSVWMGYIKDYEGGTLMQCLMLPSVLRYLDLGKILLLQRAAIEKKIKQRSHSNIVRPGLQIFKNAKSGTIKLNPLKDIPGLAESGWLEEMDKLAQKPKRGPHYNFMVTLLSEMQNHPSAWPFATPVNKDEVDDYYEVIKEPMDLSTMELKLENDKYETFDQFLYDGRLIYNNCRSYNAESTTYYKNATKLEKFMTGKIKDNPDFAHYLE